MNEVLHNYVKEAKERTKDRQGVPIVPKKISKVVNSWKRKGIASGVANHSFLMNRGLTCQAYGTIVPGKIRLQRDARERSRRRNAEARALGEISGRVS
jgi:hypothetical protein